MIEIEHVWKMPPEFIEARQDEVHVWRVFLNNAPEWVQSLSKALSEEERQRANRLTLQRERQDFIVTRALLRILVGRYLKQSPDTISFSYGANGKPYLAVRNGYALRFNLSHSEGIALYAVSLGREVGIDIEIIRDVRVPEVIAELFFSPRERAALKSLPEEIRSKAFFTCWTRKEAYLKARGDGLAVVRDSFSVSLEPGASAALLEVSTEPDEVSRWSLVELNPDSRYVSALAVEGDDMKVRCWQLTGDMQELPLRTTGKMTGTNKPWNVPIVRAR